MNTVSGILLLGGIGTRFERSFPKQFVNLGGKPLFLHTVEAFEPYVDELILVCHPDWMSYVKEKTRHTVIPGGETRQESSYKGICAARSEYVLIHDAVRPFVSQQIIQDTIRSAIEVGAADVCIPTADTIVEGTTSILSIPDRNTLRRGQTPQGFKKALVRTAHEATSKKNATDDCQLVHDLGHKVAIVQGSESNIKITTDIDLTLAEQLLKQKALSGERTPLWGKSFVVIGGQSGIGKGISDALEAQGARVHRWSRSIGFDATDPACVRDAFEKIGPLDGVIAAQGFLKTGTLRELSDTTLAQMVSVNFTSLLYVAKYAQIKAEGHLLHIGSSSYSYGRGGYAAYAAAKAAVVNLTQGIAQERPDVYVNALIPGRTNTKMRTENFGFEANLLEVDEVAKAALEILSQRGITGIFHEVRQKKRPYQSIRS